MSARIWKVAAALCLVAAAAGCSEEESGYTPPPASPTIRITPSATTVVANGTNTVTLSVTDTGAAAVTVTTDRGTFAGGATSVTIPAGAGVTTGSVVLTTCDSSANVGCAGAVTVTASSTTGSATASLTFVTLASACATNCAAATGCAGLACTLPAGGTGSCSATSPSACTAAPACTPSPAGATTETSCTDDVDNDCDGDLDCEDADCDALACDTASATSVCRSGVCTDLASGLAVTVTPDRTRLPANGTTSTTLRIRVTSNEEAAPNLAVTIATTAGTLSATTATTDATGRIAVTLTAPATPGVAVITANVTAVPTVRGTATVTIPRLGSFQIPDPHAVHPVMGVRTSGWNEFGGVLVQVLDDQGQPYPDGQVVRFEHRRLGGSTFAPPLAPDGATCAAASNCVAYEAPISGGADAVDQTGLASAPLVAGTVAGTLVVTVSTTASGITRTATLPNVAVVGAKTSLANLSVVCAPRNVPALAETDCAVSWVDAPITCAALLKDRFNNLLGTSTQVIFASEAAPVGQVAWTAPYDPAAQGPEQPDLGTATQIFQTLGGGLPFDVDPQPGEASVDHALDGCGLRTHNPRDGVAAIIAVVDGEEAFFDQDGSGAWEAGEPFVDQGEPFVDQDDDGAYTLGEWFLDVDGDLAYTPGNGAWDAFAKIWTETAVVYTAYSETVVEDPAVPTFLGTRWIDAGTFSDACTPTPAPAPFAVLAKVTGPPEIPPTSEDFVVVASDWNLNRLSEGATYQVAVVGDGKVKFVYRGLASYADDLGMSFRYWPCDQNGNCASQCRATGADAPCTMTPSIAGFSCGIAASVTITGGEEPDGFNVVDFRVDTPWDVFLRSKVMHDVVSIGGTNL